LQQSRGSEEIASVLVYGCEGVVSRRGNIGLNRDHLLQFLDCQVFLMVAEVGVSQVRWDAQGDSVEVGRLLELLDGFVHPSYVGQEDAVPFMDRWIAGRQVKRALELMVTTWKIPVLHTFDPRKGLVRFG